MCGWNSFFSWQPSPPLIINSGMQGPVDARGQLLICKHFKWPFCAVWLHANLQNRRRMDARSHCYATTTHPLPITGYTESYLTHVTQDARG